MLIRFLAGVTTRATPAESFAAGQVVDLPVASALHWITRGLAVEQPIEVIEIGVADVPLLADAPEPPPRPARPRRAAPPPDSEEPTADEPD